jgi:hypothetical protein
MSAPKRFLRPDVKLKSSMGKELARIRHRSIADITHALDLAIAANAAGDTKRGRMSSCKKGSNFAGTESAEQYRDMLRDGWPEAMQGVSDLEGLSTDQRDKLRFTPNVAGAFANVPAFLHGSPLSMHCPAQQLDENAKGVTLILDGSFGASINSADCLKYAITVMGLVAWLEAEQIETSVYVSLALDLASQKYVYLVPVREQGSHLAPERIASILHPSFLRRGYFAMLESEHCDHKLPHTGQCRRGYGSATTATAEEMRLALPDAASVILLPKVGAGCPTRAVEEALSLKLKGTV